MVSELLDKQKLTVLNEDLKKVEIDYNETNRYLESQNKKVRDYAAKEFNKINTKYLEIAEFEINSILENM
jgi:predicted patatin/cPLA2 family phospholipase